MSGDSKRLRAAVENGRQFGTVWSFTTRRFRVTLRLERLHRYQYDGDDSDGTIQAELDSGSLVAFDSCVSVELDGVEIGADYLGGSVYASGETSEFFRSHWDSPAASRNCAANAYSVCHYFPDMVSTAIAEAREHVRRSTVPPYIREAL